MSKYLNKPQYLIIHCSAYAAKHSAKDVHAWHTKRGWSGIGYHDIIEMNGRVSRGRPYYWKGSHCKAKGMNHKSIGLCILGDQVFSEKQWATLKEQVLYIVSRYPDIIVCGHNDFERKKPCPNFSVKDWVSSHPDMAHVRTL